MTIARVGRRSVLVALALAFGLLLGGVTPASGQASGSTGTLANAGVLRLRLGAQDHFRYEPPTGAPSTQSISEGSQCRLSLGSSPSLVSFQGGPATPYPGFVGDAIGVRSGGGTGTPCSRIDPGETLTMDLGSALSGKFVDFAEIDVEGKFGATYKIQGYAVTASSTRLMKSETYETSVGGSDSGPDSGDGDNFRVRFPKTGFTAVNRLEISIVGSVGSASLEGGADGTQPCNVPECDPALGTPSLGLTLTDDDLVADGTTDSLFHLIQADGVLDCGQTAPSQGGGSIPLNSLKRLNNATGLPSECIPIPFDLDSSVNGPQQLTTLLKNLFLQDAQFEWTVTWAPEFGTYMEDETEFDFDGDGEFHPIQLCLPDGTVGPADGFPDLPVSLEEPPARDPWCVKFTSTTLITGGPDNGKVVVMETYFGKGDPTGRR
jgi:hypothetical protein